METGKEESKQGLAGAGEGSGAKTEEGLEEWQRQLVEAYRTRGNLARHRAHCTICQHEQREEIEEEFLNWANPRLLVETYKLGSVRAVYRHVHAVGLYLRRRYNREAALDRVIQCLEEVDFNGRDVVAAIRLGLEQERKIDGFVAKVAGKEMKKILVPMAEEVAEFRRMNRGSPEWDEPELDEEDVEEDEGEAAGRFGQAKALADGESEGQGRGLAEGRRREKSRGFWGRLRGFSIFRRRRGRGDE